MWLRLQVIPIASLLLFSGCCRNTIEHSPYGYYPECWDDEWIPPNPTVSQVFRSAEVPAIIQEGTVSLGDLLDIALRNNPHTEKSWAHAISQYYNYRGSRSTLSPSVDVIIGATPVNSGGGSVAAEDAINPVSATIGGAGLKTTIISEQVLINYLLLDFGGRCARIEAAKQALVASNWTHNQAIQDVLFLVIKNYYNAQKSLEATLAAEANLKDAETTARSSEIQFQAGVKNKLDYLQALSNVMKRETELQNAIGEKDVAFANLASSVGLEPSTVIKIATLNEIPQVEVTDQVEELINLAKRERSDLSSLMANYYEKEAEACAARSALYPTINANVDASNYDFLFGRLKKSYNYSATIELQWNIFNGFKDLYKMYKAKSEKREAYASWKELELQVGLDVVSSYTKFKTANENLSYSDQYLLYAKEAYHAALVGYKAGTNDLVTLLNAQSTLAEARAQDIQARSDFLTALANISYSTGVLHHQYKDSSLCE